MSSFLSRGFNFCEQEEVSDAVTVLKSEYEGVVESLKKQNEVLDAMVKKLERDYELSQKRCQELEAQLGAAQKDAEIICQLRQTISDMKCEAMSMTHQLEVMSAELESKKVALNKATETLEALQLKNDNLTVVLAETRRAQAGGDADAKDGLKSMVEELKQDLQQAKIWASESSNKVQECNQWAGELQKQLNFEKTDFPRHGEKLSPLSPASEVRLSDALTMTDPRWNNSGLMGVVQKQKEEIETLKAECQRLKKSLESPTAQESKMSQDSVNLLRATKEILSEGCGDKNKPEKRQPPVVSPRKMIDPSKGKSNKRVTASPKRNIKVGSIA